LDVRISGLDLDSAGISVTQREVIGSGFVELSGDVDRTEVV